MQPRICAPCRSDRLAHKMNRPQASHQNQRRYVNSNQQNNGADLAKNIAEQAMMPIGKTITDPAAWSLDIESRMPPAQMIRLQMEQTGARNDKKNDPRDSLGHPQTRVKQFHYTEAKKNRSQKIRGSADQLITDSRDNCAE